MLYYFDLRLVFTETVNNFAELMTDLFGNYLCQAVIERCGDDQRVLLLQSLGQRLHLIAMDRQGTRAVQKLAACCKTREQVCDLLVFLLVFSLR